MADFDADDANNSRYSTQPDQFNVIDKCRLEMESATPKIAAMHLQTHARAERKK